MIACAETIAIGCARHRGNNEQWPDVDHSLSAVTRSPPSRRVHAKNGRSIEELKAVILTAPAGLGCSWNLGMADFYPGTSGKLQAAR